MSYSRGMGLAFQPQLNLTVAAPATSNLTYATTRSASAPLPGVSMGFSGENGRLQALKILIRPYLVALQQATLAGNLALVERAQLAERLKSTRNLGLAVDAVRPAAGGWVRRDIERLQAIAASGNLPTAQDLNLLTRSGNTTALQYARQIAQAWRELQSSLVASGWWSSAPPSSGPAGTPITPGLYRGIVGRTLVGGSTGSPAADRAREDAANAAVTAERAAAEAEAARQRADSEAAIAASRAEAEAAAATAAALQDAVSQAGQVPAEQQAQLQAALQQAEAAATDAAQRAQAELDASHRRGKLWVWGLLALGAGGVGYLILRRR